MNEQVCDRFIFVATQRAFEIILVNSMHKEVNFGIGFTYHAKDTSESKRLLAVL
jgi:hypothetical protein